MSFHVSLLPWLLCSDPNREPPAASKQHGARGRQQSPARHLPSLRHTGLNCPDNGQAQNLPDVGPGAKVWEPGRCTSCLGAGRTTSNAHQLGVPGRGPAWHKARVLGPAPPLTLRPGGLLSLLSVRPSARDIDKGRRPVERNGLGASLLGPGPKNRHSGLSCQHAKKPGFFPSGAGVGWEELGGGGGPSGSFAESQGLERGSCPPKSSAADWGHCGKLGCPFLCPLAHSCLLPAPGRVLPLSPPRRPLQGLLPRPHFFLPKSILTGHFLPRLGPRAPETHFMLNRRDC